MNKVCLITGARRGLGKACAIKFAKNGYDIVLNDFLEFQKECEVLKHDLEETYQVQVTLLCGDVSKEDEVRKMVQLFEKKYNQLDVLINNASIVYDLEVTERSTEMFEKTLLNNVTGTYLMCKLFGKFLHIKKDFVSKIINISSTNGIDCNFPTSIDYDASKAAIISLTKNFAIEYAPNVLVNAVAPGWMNTEMNKDLPKELIQEECDKIYLHRFAEASEVANLVYFLGSSENSYINAETIVIDGGY